MAARSDPDWLPGAIRTTMAAGVIRTTMAARSDPDDGGRPE